MDKVRVKASFYGQVQGVGFRYSATHLAEMFGLTGWVRNEYDGSVSVEIQGDRYSVEEWFLRIGQRRFIEVDRVERQELDLIPDEHSFGVKF